VTAQGNAAFRPRGLDRDRAIDTDSGEFKNEVTRLQRPITLLGNRAAGVRRRLS
jgi:hypothetical protein